MYLYNGGQVMSLNMSGPRMTLAPLIRVLVSSDGSWSRQPRLVFRNIEVMDSRAHLDQQFTESSIYIPSNKVSPVDVRQNVLDNRIFSPPTYKILYPILKSFIKARPFLLEEVTELQGAGIHRGYVEHSGARPHHVHLHEGAHLLPRGTVGPHQTLGRLVHVTTHLCKDILSVHVGSDDRSSSPLHLISVSYEEVKAGDVRHGSIVPEQLLTITRITDPDLVPLGARSLELVDVSILGKIVLKLLLECFLTVRIDESQNI